MWKTSHTETTSIAPLSEPSFPALRTNARPAVAAAAQSCIGKGLVLVGNISGAESLESLFIDGSVDGSIILPSSRVTVGLQGKVKAGIKASDIVVMGKVLGNITASNRVDLRASGYVTGNISAPRVSIEDGAFFLGKLDASSSESKPAAVAEQTARPLLATPQMVPVLHEVNKPVVHRSLQSA
jgi:cytoskeletal protein CcmA (bactofilin family)